MKFGKDEIEVGCSGGGPSGDGGGGGAGACVAASSSKKRMANPSATDDVADKKSVAMNFSARRPLDRNLDRP